LGLSYRRYIAIVVMIAGSSVVLSAFQNCSKADFSSQAFQSLNTNASVMTYKTQEEVPLSADLVKDGNTLSSYTQIPSTFALVKNPGHGKIVFHADATFTYSPDKDFNGEDSYQFSETQKGDLKALIRTVSISVEPVDDLPVIKTEFLSYEMNSNLNVVKLDITDVDDGVVKVRFSEDESVLQLATTNGKLTRQGDVVYYTPNQLFRGAEQVAFWAVTPGGKTKKTISITVGSPFRAMEPALAIRAVGCVECHANVRSNFVTDFGYGNSYFAGQGFAQNAEPLTFQRGTIYGDHGFNWVTSTITAPILVPVTTKYAFGATDGTTKTLAEYLRSQEAKKAVPTQVSEKSKVYIGAPTVAQLIAKFQVAAATESKFLPNDQTSPAFSGFSKTANGVWTNTADVVCDGDLYLKGTVQLNKPVIKTKNGCRIYATGPIFVQEAPSYVNLGDAIAANNTNLQLVSARVIVMGVGTTHCETATTPTHWYYDQKVANPLVERFRDIWTIKSHVTRTVSDPVAEGAAIISEAAKLTNWQDASCYAGGRNVHLERILLNAPMIQSRFTGNVSGVVITEVALFSLSAFSYQFDDVFKRVNVLPMLAPAEFLDVQ
jgi:hypothetical protein